MKEKVDELYQEYLNEKLDLVFNVAENENTDNKQEKNYTNNQDKYIPLSDELLETVRKEYHRLGLFFHENDVKIFENGYAEVTCYDNGYVCNFIDTNGKILSPNLWFGRVWAFQEGCARVKKDGKYNFINTKGEIISPNLWYDEIFDFQRGFAVVHIKGKGYNYINTKGELLSPDLWFEEAYCFQNGFACVKSRVKHLRYTYYNFIDTKGQILSPIEWFDEVRVFKDGFACVKKYGKYNLIDSNGQFLLDEWIKFDGDIDEFEKRYHACKQKNMSDYAVKKSLIRYQYIDDSGKYKFGIGKGYKCQNDKDKFNVRFEPLIMYGIRYVLCLNKDEVFLYDRETMHYKLIGFIINVEFDNNFIYDNKNKKVYFIYENKMYDITKYYNTKLKGKKIARINPKIIGILTREEFSFHKMEEIDRLMEEEKEKNKKMQEKIDKEKQLEKLNELKEKEARGQEENEKAQKEALVKLSDALKHINELRKNGNSKERMHVEEDDLFITVEDHKEINPLYIEMGLLKFINLSYVTFENVNVEGIDFRGCNDIGINPQLVYKKSLRNCNMEGIYISPFKDFTEVDIRGCKFSDDNNPKTIDRMNTTIDDAIYDETTTYNGIPLTKMYGEFKHKRNKKN